MNRYLTARYTGNTKDHSLGALLGIGIDYNLFTRQSLAFPDPGYLAAQHLHISLSRLAIIRQVTNVE